MITKGTVEEDEFLLAFEDLIDTFSKYPLTSSPRTLTTKEFFDAFTNDNQTKSLSIKVNNKEPKKSKKSLLLKKFNTFIETLERTNFKHDLIPYDKITDCVFQNTPEEMLYSFTTDIRNFGDNYFNKKREQKSDSQIVEKSFYKILRHIDLALVQKNSIASFKIKEMDSLKQDYEELKNHYKQLKKEADMQYQSMLTQYISILGIFAGILMGAFGAIQAFTSLFNNASKLSLGKLLIISSIGASAVILILFFLLNAIAKLTNRSLSSTTKANGTMLEKHPTLVIVHGILLFICLIAAALELCNIKLHLAWQGLWWILPCAWVIYLIFAVNRKSFLFFLQKNIKNNNYESNKKGINLNQVFQKKQFKDFDI